METDNFFPSMARCPDCGRFIRRGLTRWMDHAYGNCPKSEYNNGFKDGLIRMYYLKKLYG